MKTFALLTMLVLVFAACEQEPPTPTPTPTPRPFPVKWLFQQASEDGHVSSVECDTVIEAAFYAYQVGSEAERRASIEVWSQLDTAYAVGASGTPGVGVEHCLSLSGSRCLSTQRCAFPHRQPRGIRYRWLSAVRRCCPVWPQGLYLAVTEAHRLLHGEEQCVWVSNSARSRMSHTPAPIADAASAAAPSASASPCATMGEPAAKSASATIALASAAWKVSSSRLPWHFTAPTAVRRARAAPCASKRVHAQQSHAVGGLSHRLQGTGARPRRARRGGRPMVS